MFQVTFKAEISFSNMKLKLNTSGVQRKVSASKETWKIKKSALPSVMQITPYKNGNGVVSQMKACSKTGKIREDLSKATEIIILAIEAFKA